MLQGDDFIKRIIVAILLFAIAISFSGCAEEPEPDMSILSQRMAQINENYAFDYFDSFVYDGANRIFFSLCSENDVLLTVNTDSEGKIKKVNITAVQDSMKTEGERQAYKNFSSAVINSFATLSDKEIRERDKELSYNNTKIYFSDLYETYSSKRYHFVFSSNSEYISLDCEYYEQYDVSEKNKDS